MFRFLPSIPVPYKIRLHHGCPFLSYHFHIHLLCFMFLSVYVYLSACGFNCFHCTFETQQDHGPFTRAINEINVSRNLTHPIFFDASVLQTWARCISLFFDCQKRYVKKYYVSSRSLKNWKYDRSRTTYRLDGDILCTNNSRQNFSTVKKHR